MPSAMVNDALFPKTNSPTPAFPGPYTLEPCEDVHPTPDYENVLTD